MLLFELLGWIVFPISFSLFRGLADKGFSISKVLGLLFWGYIYWLGNTFGILGNNLSGTLVSLVLIILVSIIFLKKSLFQNLFDWCKENLNLIIFFEILFLIAFLGWALIRATNPEIIGTEKPMELAFINSIYRSPSFPPNDPWLSGYAISYYYFGYLLVSMIMRVGSTVSGVAFNLAISAWFALIAISSSGVLLNLLFYRRSQEINKPVTLSIMFASLLAPLFILIVSNAEGLLEVVHSRGLFWSIGQNGSQISRFWAWLDIKELTEPPPTPLNWLPGRSSGTWWWRASRVLQDYTTIGQSREIIDEFPFFSFLLADLHPHVLSIPFVLLAIYYCLSTFITQSFVKIGETKIFQYFIRIENWITGLILGALIFINTWDFPIYFGSFVLVRTLPLVIFSGFNKKNVKEIILITIVTGITSIILYLPFLMGLSSQAGGFLPSMVFRTRSIHFLIMFFPQLVLIFYYLISNIKRWFSLKQFLKTFLICFCVIVTLFIISFFVAMLPEISIAVFQRIAKISEYPPGSFMAKMLTISNNFNGIFGAESIRQLILETINRIAKDPLVILALLIILIICIVRISHDGNLNSSITNEKEKSNQYIQIIIILGALLCIFPEFFYLRDQFGWRMNTIFKFYFQAWILFSLAAAYSIVEIWFRSKNVIKRVSTIGVVLVSLGSGLIYPIFSIIEKTNSFKNVEWSLDGNKFIEISDPNEYEALTFLNTVPNGVITEAVGGSYTNYARVSKFSGLPTVLGWPGHESQWRGGATEIGTRESDIRELYSISSWEYTEPILKKYNIRYIYLGSVEHNTYAVADGKFNNHLQKIFENESVSIFEYTPGLK